MMNARELKKAMRCRTVLVQVAGSDFEAMMSHYQAERFRKHHDGAISATIRETPFGHLEECFLTVDDPA